MAHYSSNQPTMIASARPSQQYQSKRMLSGQPNQNRTKEPNLSSKQSLIHASMPKIKGLTEKKINENAASSSVSLTKDRTSSQSLRNQK